MTAGAFADAKADVAKVNLLILQATSFCNIDCRYCYLADRSAKRRMSADTLEALISALIRDELLGDEITINWHAGEPLVVGVDFYRQAAAQLRRLECTGTRVVHSVQTNGMLIDEAWCAFFRDYDIASASESMVRNGYTISIASIAKDVALSSEPCQA